MMANTTWNPADLVNITLSGGNLIATSTAGSAGVRGIGSRSSGKYYWEYSYTFVNTNSFSTGICLATASITGASAVGIAFLSRSTGDITVSGTASGFSLGAPVAPGSVVGIAVDFTAKLLWFRIAPSGNWNGSGTANPATGTGGADITSISTGPLYPHMMAGTSDKVTANFGDSASIGAVPSGFVFGFPATAAAVARFSAEFV
jgi:hypothetical protein